MSRGKWILNFHDYSCRVKAETNGANIHDMISKLCNIECGLVLALRYKSEGENEEFENIIVRLKINIAEVYKKTGVSICALPNELKELEAGSCG